MLGLDRKKLQNWYKNHLSDFTTEKVQKSLHQHDIPLPPNLQTKERISVDVPIVKLENIGDHMAVDEKYINGIFYTILTNGQTGRIALMAATTKTNLLAKAMKNFGEKLFNVKILTRDLASNYDWFARENFMNAAHVADKFHVLKHAFGALQDLRIYYRQKLLSKKRQAYEDHKIKKKDNPKLIFKYTEPVLPNNETNRQLLARSQYLLYKNRADWSASQAQRAEILFKYYPDIEVVYDLIGQFRVWYSVENTISKKETKARRNNLLNTINNKLNKWMNLVDKADITELSNFKSLVERNRGAIINYFHTSATNAIAEANNNIIQTFIRANRGIRNLDFFYFRLSQFLT